MISIKNLSVSYGSYKAIEQINLNIDYGKLIGVVGPNGAGKSTFLKAVLGLIAKDSGHVRVMNQPVKKVNKNIAYVPQRSQIDWDFPIDVMGTVLLGTYPRLGYFKRPGKKDRQWAKACLKQVGLQDFARRQIANLSGGQQQRVFLARALAQKANLFVLDEPFVGVDIGSEATIIRILKALRNQGKTVIVVHHDLSKATEYFDELVLINKQLLAFGKASEVLEPEIISAAYKTQLPLLKAS